MSRTPATTHRTRSTRRSARRLLAPIGVAALGAVVLVGCGQESDEVSPGETTQADADVEGTFVDADGNEAGTFAMTETDEGLEVAVEVTGLSEGFHGIHVHQIGACEADSAAPDDPTNVGDFLSAGGHLAEEGQEHGDHAGDLPALAVGADGVGTLRFVTDALTLEQVQDADSSAVMVHAGRDNYANIPERYAAEGPDEDTLKTGDSGDRVLCGAVPGA